MDNKKICIYCCRYCENDEELDEHLKICKKRKQRDFTRKSKKFKCLYCGIICKSKDGLEKHNSKCSKKKKMKLMPMLSQLLEQLKN